jgi:hypothetical protein
MARGRSIMDIFNQNVYFLNILIVLEAGVRVLKVYGAS